MIRVTSLSFSLIACLAGLGQAHAWSCPIPGMGGYVVGSSEVAPSEETLRRLKSRDLAERFRANRDAGFPLVLGRLSQNSDLTFLHESQLDEIRSHYWPPSNSAQMPASFTYTYWDAYRFEGHRLLGTTLVPFSTDSIDLRISVIAEYQGAVGSLPVTERDIIGVLRPDEAGGNFSVQTDLCPSYFEIDAEGIEDLLACYRSGDCQ